MRDTTSFTKFRQSTFHPEFIILFYGTFEKDSLGLNAR